MSFFGFGTPKITLHYFDARGVAESIRYLLAMAKVPYEDNRFSLAFGTPGDFSTIIRPEFDAAKESGALVAGCDKVPILEVDGVKVGQSKACERFVAKKFGFMGSGAMEEFQVDCLCEHIRDIKDTYQKEKVKGDEAKEKYFGETLPEFLKKVEKSLGDSKGPWLVGTKVSLADGAYMVFLTEFFDNTEGAKAATPPKIWAAVEAVNAIPAVKAWQEARPKTMF